MSDAFNETIDFHLLPPGASESAASVDLIFWVLVITSSLIVLLLAVLVVTFGVRYRAGSKASRANPPRSMAFLEVLWIVIFTVYGLVIFFWAAGVFFRDSQPPSDARTIYVVGKQWMWKIQHESGRREINELHVPLGDPIRLVMHSQDVIHSFYVPAFRLKQDVLPNRYTSLWFTAKKPGEYFLFCAEYCGADHSRMRGRVKVMEPADFQRWLSAGPGAAIPGTPGTPQAPLVGKGAGAFSRLGCGACHGLGATLIAPRLDGLFGREVHLRNDETVIADENYIRESILNPSAKIVAGFPSPSLMPTYLGRVNDQDIIELIQFLKSIKDGWHPESAP